MSHSFKRSLFVVLALATFVLAGCILSPKEVKYVYIPADTNSADTNLGYGTNYTPGSGWGLYWSDEFNDASSYFLNTNDWTYDIGIGPNFDGWGNSELEYYTSRPDNSWVVNGQFVIKAKKEVYSSSQYTSARIKTKGKKVFLYGKIAARIQLPSGQGYWPAFWMLGTNIDSVSWPTCGENDIMENRGSDNTLVGCTTIFPTNNGPVYLGSSHTVSSGVNTEFHVYEVAWSSASMIYSVDGVPFLTNTKATILGMSGTWVFDQPFYILINLAVGGNYGGNPDITTVFPGYMFVDWVRVYTN